MWFEILVRLIVPDPWSFTVLDTLRFKLGLSEVTEVSRLRRWGIMVESQSKDEGRLVVDNLLSQTALLANPNRDRWLIRMAGEPIQTSFWVKSSPQAEVFAVRVIDIDDIIGQSKQMVVQQRLGIRKIRSITFSTLWLLEIESESRRARKIAEDVAVARRWRKGLLANPHSQKAVVGSLEEFTRGLLHE